MVPLPSIPRIPLGQPSKRLKETSTFIPHGAIIYIGLGLRRFLLRLADSCVPAELPIFEQSTGMMQTVMLAMASRYEIADRLEERPQSAAELAARSRTDVDVMHRVLRALASRGVFKLDRKGLFHNNRLSRALISGASGASREWAQYFGSQSNMLAWIDLPRSLDDGLSSFDRVFGMSVWDWFEKHPDEQEMFAHSMMGVTALQAPIVARLYPFREVTRICDIGGGRGTLLSELLLKHGHLLGVLYDASGVLDSADELLKAKGVRDRVSSLAGNFFQEVPGGADAYLLKNILHDWNDEGCTRILRNLRQVMRAGQRVLIMEQLVETNRAYGLGPASDVQMLVACSNGRERSLAEIQRLFLDNDFRLGRTFRHPLISIVEAIV